MENNTRRTIVWIVVALIVLGGLFALYRSFAPREAPEPGGQAPQPAPSVPTTEPPNTPPIDGVEPAIPNQPNSQAEPDAEDN